MKARTISIIAMMFVVMLLAVVPASATSEATRILPTSCVQPGSSFTVSITADGYGDFGSVVETLCNGWTYVDGSATGAFSVVVDGNTVTFVLMGAGPKTITYNVQAPSTPGACCDISGTLNDDDATSYTVGGPTQVCVCSNSAISASATRTLPTTCIPSGDSFTVSITADGYGEFGSVVETLCNGWTYVDGSATGAFSVVVDGNTVTFVLMGAGPKTITYDVQAPSTPGACCDISGTLNDEDAISYTVGGPTQVCVCSPDGPDGPSATRTLPTSCVQPGDSFTVSITADGYGGFGSVVETLCNGWTYVDGSAIGAFDLVVDGNTVTFVLLGGGPTTIIYDVQAPSTPGACCDISGTLNNVDAISYTVGGATQVCVCIPIEGILLEEGWNFISVPYELDNSSVDYVLADINYSLPVTYYSAATGLFETVSDLEPLKGYWIKNPEEGTQVILGELLVPKEWAVPATLTVYEGWNAIGYTDPKTILDAETALTSIDESYTTIMGPFKNEPYEPYEQVGWNGQTGVINGIHVGTNVFYMGPYEAFWVLVTQEDMLGEV